MPEEEKKEPMVDIDTSGPEVEVNLEEQKKVEEPKETIQVEEISEKDMEEQTYDPDAFVSESGNILIDLISAGS